MTKPAIMTITESAAKRVKELLDKRNKPSVGIRVGLRTKGCSGLSYTLEYADKIELHEEVIEDKGIIVIIEPKAIMFLLGTTMDFIENDLESGFQFKNPNEKGRCGCGESFHI